MTNPADPQPATWLRELVRLHSSPLAVDSSVRAMVCVGGPLALGLAIDRLDLALWVTLATLTQAAGEGTGTFRSRFRQMAIAAPIALAGFSAGYLTALPYPALIAAMALLAFLAGIISSFGAPYSNGATQALLFACVMIGLHDLFPPWQSALLYLVGVAFYAAILGAQALLDRRRPERTMMAQLFAAMAELADARAQAPIDKDETPAIEAARQRTTDTLMTLYAAVTEGRRNGRTHETYTLGATLDASDIVFSSLLAARDPGALRAVANWLQSVGKAVDKSGEMPAPIPPLPTESLLRDRLNDLLAALAATEHRTIPSRDATRMTASAAAPFPSWSRLFVGRSVLRDAAALGLCIGLAFATRYVVHGDHWYWVPLTVAIVMKPDLGSIFVRAVHRAVGTSLGVIIGAFMLLFLPKGPLLVAGLAALAALLPWARAVSYAVQAVVLTPLVLILIDLLSASPGVVNDGAQRMADTLIGSAIVLIFGYFLWPSHQRERLISDLDAALRRMADYLEAVCQPPGGDMESLRQIRTQLGEARRAVYGALSNLRSSLARSMAEPPPAGREAAAWLPIVSGAERMCDRITAQAARRQEVETPPAAEVRSVADRLRGIMSDVDLSSSRQASDTAVTDPFLSAIDADVNLLAERLDRNLHELQPTRSGIALVMHLRS